MTIGLTLEGLSAYLLVFCRMGAMLFFNPVLARRNVPTQVKAALALGMTLLLAPTVGAGYTPPTETFALLLQMVLELLAGAACGYVFQLYYYLLFMVGDIIDTGFGLSMAKVFDPGTSLQTSLSGNLMQMLFVLYFFATDSHLVFVRLMAASYDVVGVGAVEFGAQVGSFMMTLFSSAFALAMQLTLPFLAASFVLEIAMGVLMKLIPQINVFVIHFQFKILLGLVLLFLFASPTANFVQNYMNTMFSKMQQLLGAL